jgi:tripartite-type tricarboxylate transporter receptor subunit TctC
VGQPADSNPESISLAKDDLPDLPPGLMDNPYAIVGPKGIPDHIKMKLHDAFKKATMDNPQWRDIIKPTNVNVRYRNPEELMRDLNETVDVWAKLTPLMGLESK